MVDTFIDSRKIDDASLLSGNKKSRFVKREIRRSSLNRLDEFIADGCEDVYRHLIEPSNEADDAEQLSNSVLK